MNGRSMTEIEKDSKRLITKLKSLDSDQLTYNKLLNKTVDKVKQELYDRAIFQDDQVAAEYLRIKFK